MDDDSFGPLTSAECANQPAAVDYQAELEAAKKREQELIHQKHVSELAFGQQRAKFMELFKQKEDELRRTAEQLSESSKSNAALKDQLWRQTAELDDVKTAVAVSEAVKMDEIERERRKCEEEIATLHHLMKEERLQWKKEEERLQCEVIDLRTKLNQDRDSFLGSITKSLQKRIGTGLPGVSRDDQEVVDLDVKKAQEDTEMLRSIVQPLEDEIESLRSQLQRVRDPKDDTVSVTSDGQPCGDDKLKELQESFNREKSSRTDLEMYVAVLNTQKSVIQEDLDKLRAQLQDVCCLLEDEKCENIALRRLIKLSAETKTLTSSRLEKIESALTTEQRQELAESGDERERYEQHLKELETLIEREQSELEHKRSLRDKNLKLNNNNGAPPELQDGDNTDTSAPTTQSSSTAVHNTNSSDNHAVSNTLPSSSHDSVTSSHYSLTEAQQKSLLAPTPESQASDALMTLAKMESLSAVGMRLIAQHELAEIHKQMQSLKHALAQPCNKCADLESRLREAGNQISSLQQEKEATDSLRSYVAELEESVNQTAKEAESQICSLSNKLQDSLTFLEATRQKFSVDQESLIQQLTVSTEDRQQLHDALEKLQTENEILVGKHSRHSRALQEELIDLPDSTEEMQLLLLKYREELIAAKVAEERASEVLGSELELLRAQFLEEQDRMNATIVQLQEQLVIERSICSELKRTRADTLSQPASAAATDVKTSQTVSSLQQQLKQERRAKQVLEEEISRLKVQVSQFHPGLRSSSADEIRDLLGPAQPPNFAPAQPMTYNWPGTNAATSGETCSSCHKRFSDTVVKVQCQHCGGVYCCSCTSKTVVAGPLQRLTNICDNCYARLAQTSGPPQTRYP